MVFRVRKPLELCSQYVRSIYNPLWVLRSGCRFVRHSSQRGPKKGLIDFTIPLFDAFIRRELGETKKQRKPKTLFG